MIETMSQFIRLALLVLGSPIALYILFFLFSSLFPEKLKKTGFSFFNIPFIAIFVGYVVLVLIYFFSPLYLDVISPSVISTSWLFVRGEEIYHSFSFDRIYSLLYGPFAYIVNGLFLFIFGPTIMSSKIASVGSSFLSLLFIFLSVRKFFHTKYVLPLLGIISGFFLIFWTYSFETRIDSMGLMLASLALFGATRKNKTWAIAIVALALGCGVNLKFSGIFYFLPALFLLWKNIGVRDALFSVFVGGIVSAIPFIAFSNISFSRYLSWLGMAGNHALDAGSFANNVLYLVFLLIPLIFFLFKKWDEKEFYSKEFWYVKILIVCMVCVSVFAAKAGSGQNHLLPFVPFLMYGYGMLWEVNKKKNGDEKSEEFMKTLFIPFIIVLLVISFVAIIRVGRLYSLYPMGAEKDIKKIIETYSDFSVQMGYSDASDNTNLNTNLPSFRPLLVFAGNEYLLDKPAFADLRESGMKLSPTFLDNFEKCKNQIWLFPRGGAPFGNVEGYGKPIFEEDFYRSFNLNFELKESTNFYDVWVCKNLKVGSNGDSTTGTNPQNF